MEGVITITINYNTDKKVDYDRLISLFNEAGWDDKTGDVDRLKAMVENSQIVVTAWHEEIMIGFARCTTDFVFNGQINNVVVDSNYRGQGIGKVIINKILATSKEVTYILRADAESQKFYRSFGFQDGPISLIYTRKS